MVSMKKELKKLEDWIILTKYMYSLFGCTKLEDFRFALSKREEGLNELNRYHITEVLRTKAVSDSLRQELDIYDDNIQNTLETLTKRNPRIDLSIFIFHSFHRDILDSLFQR